MLNEPGDGRRLLWTGLAIEAVLTPLAYLAGWFAGIDPGATLRWDWLGLVLGVIATAPLLALFAVLLALDEWPPVTRIRLCIEELLGPMLLCARTRDVAALCALAGLGEELLFRGVLQAWLGTLAGPVGGLVLGGLAFGLAHAMTPLYLALAWLIGVYLGLVWMVSGNLLVPVVAHGLYDLAALAWLSRRLPRRNFD